MKNTAILRASLLALLVALSTTAAYARNPYLCPVSGKPLPTAEQRQFTVPARLLPCFLTPVEIAAIYLSIGHDAQTTVTDPQYASGELNPDGSLRPPLTAEQAEALAQDALGPGRRHARRRRHPQVHRKLGRRRLSLWPHGDRLARRSPLWSPPTPSAASWGWSATPRGSRRAPRSAPSGLDYETTTTGQFTDASPLPFRRQVSQEVRRHGLHSIRHHMSAQGASDAKIPLARDLEDYVQGHDPSLDGRSFEMNRQGQDNPYTGLGMSDDIGLLTLDENDGEARSIRSTSTRRT